jgi:hypothetical protein
MAIPAGAFERPIIRVYSPGPLGGASASGRGAAIGMGLDTGAESSRTTLAGAATATWVIRWMRLVTLPAPAAGPEARLLEPGSEKAG